MLIRKDFSKHGWTLTEFSSRLAGGRYWQKWQSEKQAMTDALAKLPPEPASPQTAGDCKPNADEQRLYVDALQRWRNTRSNIIDPLEYQARQARLTLEQSVREELSTGRYTFTASRDAADDSNRIEVAQDIWRMLYYFDLQTCFGNYGRIREKKHLYRIRVCPPLTGPSSAELLADMPIVEAYRQFVLGDEELLRAVQSIDDELSAHAKIASMSSAFQFGNSNSEIWPVLQVRKSPNQKHLNVRLERQLIGFLSDVSDWSQLNANQIFQERLGALFSHLAVGTLVARGLSINGSMLDLPRSIWLCGFDKAIDFKTGDLVQLEDDGGVQVLFRSLMLHEPAALDALNRQFLTKAVPNREFETSREIKGKKIYAAEVVENALLRFVELNKLDGEALQKHMQKHGEKSRWISGVLQDSAHEFSDSAMRKQLNFYLHDPNWLEKLRSN
jgi:hypothetical protein